MKKLFLLAFIALMQFNNVFGQTVLDLYKPEVLNEIKHYKPGNSNIDVINRSYDSAHHVRLDTVNLNQLHFVDRLNFQWVEFEKAACFSNDFFSAPNFSYTNFDYSANFQLSYFRNNGNFGFADFKNVTFKGAFFADNADFNTAVFGEFTDFTFAFIDKGIRFDHAEFHKFADLFNLRLTDTTKFSFFLTKLPDLIDFSGNAKLKQPVDFTEADLDSSLLYQAHRWHYINLYKTDIPGVLIDYMHFRLCFYNNNETDPELLKLGILKKGDLTKQKDEFKYLYLDKHKYAFTDTGLLDKLITNDDFKKYIHQIFPSANIKDTIVSIFINHWLASRNFPQRLTDDDINSIYERVLKNFEIEGRKTSYEELDIEYHDSKHCWNFIPHYWNYYGYHKEMIFVWTLIFLTIFTLFTFKYYELLNVEPGKDNEHVYYIKSVPKAIKPVDAKDKIKVAFKNFWFSFIYTSTIFFMLSLEIKNLNFKKPGAIYIIVVYVIGILCLGYLANFILEK